MPDVRDAFPLIDRILKSKMQEHNTPGLAVAVTDREGVIWDAYYGCSDLATGAIITPNTLFEIGSIGKSFTCIPLMKLHEAGELDLHRPVHDYVPWLKLQSDHEPVTTHHIMTHTAGFGIGADFAPSARYEAWALGEMPLPYPPGQHFRYSNSGYKLLGFLVEELYDKPYGEVLQEVIFDPIGLGESSPLTTHDTRKRMAIGYETFYDDRPWNHNHPQVPATWFEYGAGDGSPVCTATELASYLRMFLNQGLTSTGRILSENSVQKMMQPLSTTPTAHYGYGLALTSVNGTSFFGHEGGTIGYLATMLGDLETGFGIVIFINGPDPSEKFQIAQYALNLLRSAILGDSPPDPPPVLTEPTIVHNAFEFEGKYSNRGETFQLVAEGERLYILHEGKKSALLKREADHFFVDHPDFNRFILSFSRENGEVVEAFHGADWYLHDRYAGEHNFIAPDEWDAFTGHYRSYNPWFTNFRIIQRKDALMILYKVKLTSFERKLLPRGEGGFLIEADNGPSPDWIGFDTIIAGRASRARIWGGDYYRTFTSPM